MKNRDFAFNTVSFHFGTVRTMFGTAVGWLRSKSGALGAHTERIWSVHLVVSNLAGQRSPVMATDPEGRLWDERENHHAPHMNILHTICTELKQHPHPNKPNCNAVLTTSGRQDLDEYFFCEKYSVQHCGSPETGPVMSQAKIHLFSSYLIKAAVLFLESCKEKKGRENQTLPVLTSFEEGTK